MLEGRRACLISQGAGLGDIFFTQKVGAHYRSLGYEIVWPVIDSLLWIRDYIPDVTWERHQDWQGRDPFGTAQFIKSKDFVYIGMDNAQSITDNLIMSSKYEICGLDWYDWDDYFVFNRFPDKEARLMEQLGLTTESEFILRNDMYASPPGIMKHNFKIKNRRQLPVVDMALVDGFTLLDWCSVIECASEIHTVDTSLNYLMEKLDLRSTNSTIYYARDRRQSDYIWKKGYHIK